MSLRSITTDVPPQSAPSKRQRVLACVLCQQRKIKCDRKTPCNHCIKSRAECIPATLATRRRKQRFPERELLDRLRKYEDLLRQNNIPFQALEKDLMGKGESANADGSVASDDEPPETNSPDRKYEARNIWHVINHGSDVAHDVVRENEINTAWDPFRKNDSLLFGTTGTAVDLSGVHPMPVHILKLWQIYLENVNPLLKVTHTLSLQPRIIEAAANFTDIDPVLETLMFSIYCVSILSLPEDECMVMFGSSKQHLLPRFQNGCQQALLNCGFLRRNDRDCLTALYLYLVSVMPSTVPQSLSCILGIAVRTAQRMGIHNESTLAKHTILEAEMRRRLWWALVIFDTRVSEMAGYSTGILGPQWNCKVPLNVNDSDLRAEMKEPPEAQGKFTEATFAVVRGELANFVRHVTFHLNFTNPVPRSITPEVQHSTVQESCAALERMVDAKYLNFCDPENPLQFMTLWMTRALLARYHLMDHLSKHSILPTDQTKPQCVTRLSYSLDMLKYDTKITTSPLTKGLRWLSDQHYPFFAYIIIVQILMRRPLLKEAEHAWEVMSDHCEARFTPQWEGHHSFFILFSKIVLRAWKARELAFKHLGEPLQAPRVIVAISCKMAGNTEKTKEPGNKQASPITGTSMDDLYMPISMPVVMDDHNWMFAAGGQGSYGSSGFDFCFGTPGQAMDIDANNFDLSAMDWDALLGDGTDSSGLSPAYKI